MDPGDQLRVSDADREATVAQLTAATGEGRLTLTEFGERAGQAYAAQTRADLAAVVGDLPAVPVSRPRATVASHVVPVGAVKRGGPWRLDRDTELGAVVGAVKLDMRRAELAASEVELRVRTVVGSVKIWIPYGVRVEVSGTSTIGSRQIDGDGAGYPDGPLLRLRIDTVLGSVKVYRV